MCYLKLIVICFSPIIVHFQAYQYIFKTKGSSQVCMILKSHLLHMKGVKRGLSQCVGGL